MLTGEAGIGKTTLMRRTLEAAADQSFRVLSSHPAESETQLSFTALIDLLDQVLEDVLPTLPDPQRRALEVALLRTESPEETPNWQAVSLAVLGVLRNIARTTPVLVAVDDLQWIDPSSARVLEYVLRRIESLPVGLAVSLRSGSPVPTWLGVERSLPQERLFDLTLGPLTLTQLGRLVRSRLGMQFPRPTLVNLHHVSGGNPFFALEIGRALARGGPGPTRGGELPMPENLRELVKLRLAGLPGESREVLLAASAMNHPTVSQVAAAVGSRQRALEGLAMASVAGIVEEVSEAVRFTHPLYRSVVYAEATGESRRWLHRELATLVTDPEERARHMAVGSEGPDPEVASALDSGARTAAARGAPDAAGQLAELARQLTPPGEDSQLVVRTTAAAEYHFEAGDTTAATQLLEEALALTPPGRLRANVLHRLATIRAHTDNWPMVEELLLQARGEAGDDEAGRAGIDRDLAWAEVNRGAFQSSFGHAQEAVALAEKLDDPGLLSEALALLAVNHGVRGTDQALPLMSRAVELAQWTEEARMMPHPAFMQGLLLKWFDDFNGARARFKAALRRVVERGDEGPLPFILYHLSELESFAGNLEEAVRYAEEGYEMTLQTGQRAVEAILLYAKALADAHLGRVDSARSAALQGLARAEETGAVIRTVQNLAVLGFLDLSVGDLSGAVGHLERGKELADRACMEHPGIFRFSGNLTEALIGLGEDERAEVHIVLLEERGRAIDRPWPLAVAARGRALLAGSRGDLHAAENAVREALLHHEGLTQPLELGRTLIVAGEIKRRTKQKADARRYLERALGTFERIGARLWAERARAELARIGGRTEGVDELTETERRIAELVAAGKTNPEVAEIMFIARKTVESNLSRIYQKLHVRSRTELAHKLGMMSASPPP